MAFAFPAALAAACLGEGSGAALAIIILRSAALCHSGMATFDEAGVSDKD